MASISYDKLWRTEFCNNVPPKDKVQDFNLNQLKLKVNDTSKKNEKVATNFETSGDEDVKNNAYLDKNSSEKESGISCSEKNYNEFKLHNNNKQSAEDLLIARAVAMFIHFSYDKG